MQSTSIEGIWTPAGLDAFARAVADEIKRVTKVVESAGIKAEGRLGRRDSSRARKRQQWSASGRLGSDARRDLQPLAAQKRTVATAASGVYRFMADAKVVLQSRSIVPRKRPKKSVFNCLDLAALMRRFESGLFRRRRDGFVVARKGLRQSRRELGRSA